MSNQVFSNFSTQYGIGKRVDIQGVSVAGAGWTAAHPFTAKLYRNDNMVVLEMPEMINAGLAANQNAILTQPFIPLEYRPENSCWFVSIRITKAGVWEAAPGMCQVNIDGSITIYPSGATGPYNWGADGNRGFDQFAVCYLI